MRAFLVFLLAIGISVAGAYAGLSRLARPPTVPDAAPPPQRVASLEGSLPPNAKDGVQERPPSKSQEIDQDKPTVPSMEQTATAKDYQAPGSCMPIGIVANGDLVFPMECRQLLEKYRGPLSAMAPTTIPPEQPAPVGRDPPTVASIDVNAPAVSHSDDARPPSHVALPPDTPQTTEENSSRPRKVRHSTQAHAHRPRSLVEMFRDPLKFNCMACLLFGYRSFHSVHWGNGPSPHHAQRFRNLRGRAS